MADERLLRRALITSAAVHVLALTALAGRLPAWDPAGPPALTVRLVQAAPARPAPVQALAPSRLPTSVPSPDAAQAPSGAPAAEAAPVSPAESSTLAQTGTAALTEPVQDGQDSRVQSPAAVSIPPTPAQAVAAVSDTDPPVRVPARFDAEYLDNPAPPYPALSRRLGEEGRVLLRVRVDANGLAREVEVQASSGYARLDRIARETVARWRFVPARRGAEAVESWVVVPVSFRLD